MSAVRKNISRNWETKKSQVQKKFKELEQRIKLLPKIARAKAMAELSVYKQDWIVLTKATARMRFDAGVNQVAGTGLKKGVQVVREYAAGRFVNRMAQVNPSALAEMFLNELDRFNNRLAVAYGKLTEKKSRQALNKVQGKFQGGFEKKTKAFFDRALAKVIGSLGSKLPGREYNEERWR